MNYQNAMARIIKVRALCGEITLYRSLALSCHHCGWPLEGHFDTKCLYEPTHYLQIDNKYLEALWHALVYGTRP